MMSTEKRVYYKDELYNTSFRFAIPFFISIAIAAIASICVSTIYITSPYCIYEAGSCSGYVTSKSCIINDNKFQVNGAFNCITQCANNSKYFKCQCPEYLFWDESNLKCSQICFESLSQCNKSFVDINCIPKSFVRGGFNCLMSCGTHLTFSCSCPENYTWCADYSACILKQCPVEGLEVCDNSTESIPCFNSSDDKYKCETFCVNGTLTYKCEYPQIPQIPSKKVYDVLNQMCVYVYKCIYNNGTCLDYPDNRPCIPDSNVIEWTNCTTISNDYRSFNYSCYNDMIWNTKDLNCNRICPFPAMPNCSTLNANIDCFTDLDINGGRDCKTICNNTSIDFECSCPWEKIWIPEKHRCELACFHEEGSCETYIDSTPCISRTLINSNCSSICNETRSYRCSCPSNYYWDDLQLKCNANCLLPSEICVEEEEGIDCRHTQDLNGGDNCQILCLKSTKDFQCMCPEGKIWLQDNHTCIYECKSENGTCTNYEAGKDCIPSTCTNNGINCLTSCEESRSFYCFCPFDYYWNNNTLRCEQYCSILQLKNCIDGQADIGISCSSDSDVNGEKLCKTICLNNSTDYVCSCPNLPVPKIWSAIDHTCFYRCLNENGTCDEYISNETCIPNTNVNGGFNCTTTCDEKRNFICKCPQRYSWSFAQNRCLITCVANSESCSFPNEYVDCNPATEIVDGYDCIGRCRDNLKNYFCFCKNTKNWNYDLHQCTT